MRKILLVEDSLLLAENIIALLEERKFNIYHASNAGDAINLVASESFDLILCDIMLPGKDGYEILESLKTMPEIAIPPFVFLTAKSQRIDLRKGMELGADDYLTKPFTEEELLKTIDTQIKKRANLLKSNKRNKYKTSKINDTPDVPKLHKHLSYDSFIFLNAKENPGFFAIKEIVYIKSLKDYTQIFFKNSQKLVVRKTLVLWESILPPVFFVRIHKQTIINLQFVEKVIRDSSYTFKVYLKNCEDPFKISQRYSRKIKNMKGMSPIRIQ